MKTLTLLALAGAAYWGAKETGLLGDLGAIRPGFRIAPGLSREAMVRGEGPPAEEPLPPRQAQAAMRALAYESPAAKAQRRRKEMVKRGGLTQGRKAEARGKAMARGEAPPAERPLPPRQAQVAMRALAYESPAAKAGRIRRKAAAREKSRRQARAQQNQYNALNRRRLSLEKQLSRVVAQMEALRSKEGEGAVIEKAKRLF